MKPLKDKQELHLVGGRGPDKEGYLTREVIHPLEQSGEGTLHNCPLRPL